MSSTKVGLSGLRGHAREMYVSAELMRRGWLAAMTARGSRSFDILARRADRPVFTAIRVKTGHSASFLWNAKKDGTLFLDVTEVSDFTVIVDLPKEGQKPPTYYVVPTAVLERHLHESHAAWLAEPGAKGQRHDDATTTRSLCFDDKIERIGHGYALKFAEYKEAWHLLEAVNTSSAGSTAQR
jgi:hypothetical protein